MYRGQLFTAISRVGGSGNVQRIRYRSEEEVGDGGFLESEASTSRSFNSEYIEPATSKQSLREQPTKTSTERREEPDSIHRQWKRQRLQSDSEHGRTGTLRDYILRRTGGGERNLLRVSSEPGPDTIAAERRRVTENLCRQIIQHCKKGELVRFITFFTSREECLRILSQCSEEVQPQGPSLRIASVHWDNDNQQSGHIHFIHDCNRNHGSCRCTVFRKLEHIRYAKGKVYCTNLTIDDIICLLLYFCEEGKETAYILFGNARAALPTQDALLQLQGHRWDSGPGKISVCGLVDDLPLRESECHIQAYPGSDVNSNAGGSRKGWKATRKGNDPQLVKLKAFCLAHYHVPLDSITRSKVWLESEFEFIRIGDKNLRLVFDAINSSLVHKTLSQLEDFWLNDVGEYFWESEESVNLGHKYLTVDESVKLLEKFLVYQMGDGVEEFLTVLANVLNRRTHKKNSIEIVSPPSAGKNWFFDPLFIFLGSHGQIKNVTKYTNFAFDNCFNKRVLFWNEPQFENQFYETCLMLLAGDPLSADAKWLSVAQIVRTPVIITCNQSKFPSIQKWNDRMYRFTWSSCDWLNDVHERINPLSYVALFRKYNVLY